MFTPNTIANAKKILINTINQEYQDFEIDHLKQIDFIGYDAKVKQIEEMLKLASQYMPGLELFRETFKIMDQTLKQEYVKQICAIESSLFLTGGSIVVSQPNNFSAECIAIASLL